ncbi:MFS transporter [Pseudomonas sp. NPDC090208]|uniref:MFS transporter n=1 Tax=Pseudomonas sp. NPDC090208 TaxID=3364478 RepID=UPI0037FA2B46
MRNLDVTGMLDAARFNAFHARLLLWGALIIVFDGYDLVIYGVVLPALMNDWGLTALQAGLLGSCALMGMMLGALIFGPLADYIGRRRSIFMCVALFSSFTVLNGFADSPEAFAVLRLLAGVGLGGVMPNIIALMNEYAPRKQRSTLIALMFSGYAAGGMLSAGLGMLIVPAWGWRPLFFMAAVPLLVLPLLIRQLPESINFLLRSGQRQRAQLLLQRVLPRYVGQPSDHLLGEEGQQTRVSIIQLFQDGRLINTLLLWLAFACSLLMIYGLSAWLPKMMTMAGYALTSSIAFLLILNAGAIVGSLFGGWLADRCGLGRVLLAFLAASGVVLGLMAVKSPLSVMYVLIGIAGAGTTGAQILANAFAVQSYPAHIRSTGLGWAMGIGRIGAIVGPLLGAVLQGFTLPLQVSFLVFAIPGLIGAAAIGVFLIRTSRWQDVVLEFDLPNPPPHPSVDSQNDPRLWVRSPDL